MHSCDESDVAYFVKFINPKKKSMYFVKKWRINRRFQSVTEVQRELKQIFKHGMKILNLAMSNLVMEQKKGRNGR